MTMHARRATVTILLAGTLVTGACNGARQPTAPTGPVTSAPPTTATPSTTIPPASTSQSPELEAGKDAVRKFWTVVDQLGADKQRSLDELTTVAREQTLTTWRDLLTNQRRRGYVQVGHVSVASSTADMGPNGEVTIDACIDVSDTDLQDQAETSVVPDSRPPRVRYTYTVRKSADGTYLVIQDKAVGTC